MENRKRRVQYTEKTGVTMIMELLSIRCNGSIPCINQPQLLLRRHKPYTLGMMYEKFPIKKAMRMILQLQLRGLIKSLKTARKIIGNRSVSLQEYRVPEKLW